MTRERDDEWLRDLEAHGAQLELFEPGELEENGDVEPPEAGGPRITGEANQ